MNVRRHHYLRNELDSDMSKSSSNYCSPKQRWWCKFPATMCGWILILLVDSFHAMMVWSISFRKRLNHQSLTIHPSYASTKVVRSLLSLVSCCARHFKHSIHYSIPKVSTLETHEKESYYHKKHTMLLQKFSMRSTKGSYLTKTSVWLQDRRFL